MAQYKDGGYEDILNDRRTHSDLQYVLRSRVDIPHYKYSKPRTPNEIKQAVLTSDRVKYTVEKVELTRDHVNIKAHPKLNPNPKP